MGQIRKTNIKYQKRGFLIYVDINQNHSSDVLSLFKFVWNSHFWLRVAQRTVGEYTIQITLQTPLISDYFVNPLNLIKSIL